MAGAGANIQPHIASLDHKTPPLRHSSRILTWEVSTYHAWTFVPVGLFPHGARLSYCQLIHADATVRTKERRSHLFFPSGGQGWNRDLPPDLEFFCQLPTVYRRRKPMS